MSRSHDHNDLRFAGLVLGGLAATLVLAPKLVASFQRRRQPAPGQKTATVLAARRLNRAAGTLALSVLADSTVEHYRGSFKNKAMFTPLMVSALTLATSAHGTADMRPTAHRARDTIYV